ncbi:MAG: crossover junction endodeoxyribonuclease RuvC [Candidatus Yanofskybacteria bacterium RIFCSPHIGHO2_02_FULL_43_22]|uniref:Crossover junction endodeoxyribonuclease RuvC n=1 Tax=Candidatus Yanofskybacteria bacterium RIFCSPHIGHO2_02_FULL_43_22 TaxID=1802681 RepID=A0A1F8FSU9_9BACT|nr:MAG: crossover junction endodeoxyribonuclease RuvC [Candidatus Yanofskybacteria bacterium RIFCSPHIGHO2_02_FULL_43_22]
MVTLGLDPGTTKIGYGIVRSEKNRFSCVDYGILKIGSDKLTGFKEASRELEKLIKKHKPDQAGIERLFFFKNQKTVMAVSEMRGVLLLTLAENNIPIQEFTPLQVKQSISAYGRAEKAQMQRIVQLLLNLKEPIRPDDAADALAIAICCTNNRMF